MSNFAPAPVVPTELLAIAGKATPQALAGYAEAERKRFGKARSKKIRDMSVNSSCFVYSVGPFSFSRQCASKGSKYFPGLPKDKVLLPDDYSVSFCFANEGMPAETYPGNERNTWIDHEPQEFIGVEVNGELLMFSDNPGYDEALRFIGAHPQSPHAVDGGPGQDDLRPRGIFVSLIPEQKKPELPDHPGEGASAKMLVAYERDMADYEEAKAVYDQWIANVSEAREFLRKMIVEKLDDVRVKYNRGQDAELMLERPVLEDLANIAKQAGIEIDTKWFKQTGEASGTRKCIGCGSTLLSKLQCAACGKLQVSKKVYDREMAKREAENDAAILEES